MTLLLSRLLIEFGWLLIHHQELLVFFGYVVVLLFQTKWLDLLILDKIVHILGRLLGKRVIGKIVLRRKVPDLRIRLEDSIASVDSF